MIEGHYDECNIDRILISDSMLFNYFTFYYLAEGDYVNCSFSSMLENGSG
jgi:hypothetical protein